MSLRYEQYNALRMTRDFLRDILSKECYPANKTFMRTRASDCLKHFPMIIDGRPVFSQDEFSDNELDKKMNGSDREQEITKHPHC